MKNKFTMYSKPNCPFCVKVKDYFEENNINYDVIDITIVPEGRAKLVDEGFKTVPQVYLEGIHYGDATVTLDKLAAFK